jgi:peptide/nickel transport system substrate-binding protein
MKIVFGKATVNKNFPTKLRILFVVLLAVLLTTGSSGALAHPTAQAKTELKYGINNNVDTLDPNVTTFSSVGIIMNHVVDPLVWEPTLGKYEPGLATEWSVNADATEYTFKLRQGVKFHDGTPFNGEAVKFTFDRIANPDTKSQTAVSLLGPYQETQVVDDYDIVVKFKSPFAPFLDSAAQPYLGIVSPTAVQKAGADWGVKTIVGTGPFMIQSYTPDSEVVLARNPDYNWAPQLFGQQGASKLEKITFKIIQEPATRLAALESGEVDFIDDVPTQDVQRLKDEKKFNVVQQAQPGSGWSLMMNVENPPTDDLAVRKAIALGSDKVGMIQTVWNGIGTPGCGPLTHPMFGFDPKACDYLPYNPDEAGKVLDAAGWKMGADGIREKDGKKLVIQHYFRADSFPGTDMAAFMKADLKKIGIDVNLNGLAQAGYFDAVRSGKHNTQNWWDTATDPDAMVRTLLHSSNANGGTNRNRYKNAEMDKLIDQAAGESNPEKRAALYAQIQKKVADDAVMVFYNDPFLLYAHALNLTGVMMLGGGNLPDFYAASFQ